MKIAITSASGQLGRSIVKALIQEVGIDNIVAIARTPENAEHLGVEVRKGDYNSQEKFNKALNGIDNLILISGMDDPKKRIQQHINVIEAAKLNGVKKIVYTSIIGDENRTAFSNVVKSNRQTEEDIQNSGLQWVIGINGIYIEPDLAYIDSYIKEGEVRNCAGKGKCAYTSRKELAFAYAKMILENKHNGEIYNLAGKAISQTQLVAFINEMYGTKLIYNPISVKNFEKERKEALGIL